MLPITGQSPSSHVTENTKYFQALHFRASYNYIPYLCNRRMPTYVKTKTKKNPPNSLLSNAY